jgi:hypothetical protein
MPGHEDYPGVQTGRLSRWLTLIFGGIAIACGGASVLLVPILVLIGDVDAINLFSMGLGISQAIMIAAVGPIIGLLCGSPLSRRFCWLLAMAVGSGAGFAVLWVFVFIVPDLWTPTTRSIFYIVLLVPLAGAAFGAVAAGELARRIAGFSWRAVRRTRWSAALCVCVLLGLGFILPWISSTDETAARIVLAIPVTAAIASFAALTGADRAEGSGFAVSPVMVPMQ